MKKVAQQFARENVSRRLSPGLNDERLQPEIVRVATAFSDLQQLRHEADYDMTRRFTRQEVLALIGDAERAFEDWKEIRKSVQADTFLVGLLAYGNMRI